MGRPFPTPVSPLVGITCDRRAPGADAPAAPVNASGRVRPARAELYLAEALVQAVRSAGGLPVLLPPGALPAADLDRLLGLLDGLIVSGGAFDIHPRHYGQDVDLRLDRVDEARTGLELSLCRAALARGLPVLGVCGGMQALAVAAGGSLVQDIAAALPDARDHEQPTDPATPDHAVQLLSGRLHDAVGAARITVNSTHHQAVDDPGALRICGRAPDGVIEAVEHPDHPFAVGVQWHPELLDDPATDRIFAALVGAARAAKAPHPRD